MEKTEFQKLLAAQNCGHNPHVDSDLGFLRYIKDADKIKSYLSTGKILDWGCGLGQMSYLLKNRGFNVVSYDLDQSGEGILSKIGQQLVLAKDEVRLPFPDAYFDAVLSSGVLEHVSEPLASLKEIKRILKPKGYFFVFRLPNKYSYIEFISDLLRRGDHPVKYSRYESCQMLKQFGFNLLAIKYQGFLPYNLKGFPVIIRRLYHSFDSIWVKLDSLLSGLPIINRVSTNLELVARKWN